MKQWLIFVLLACWVSCLPAQIGVQFKELRETQDKKPFSSFLSGIYFAPILPFFETKAPIYLYLKEFIPANKVPKWYDPKELAFFCRIEVQLEKSVRMPFKFRLGNVDYVDYLEGKGNY